MNIKKSQENNVVTFALSGRLDTITAPELEAELKQAWAAAPVHLVIGIEALDYISSAGLRVLLMAQKKVTATGTSMRITGCSDTIREIFDVTGFADIMTIE